MTKLTDPIKRPNGMDYYPRYINDKLDVEVLRKARETGVPILLAGPPGSGKTACVEAAFGDELVTLTCHEETEASDFLGSYVEKEDRTVQFVYGKLIEAMRRGAPFLIDDITLADPRALAVLYPVMDGRNTITIPQYHNEEVVAEDGFWIVGCHNPGVHGAILTEALASRFLCQIDVETDYDMAAELGVSEQLIKLVSNMKQRQKNDKIQWVPQMRELLAFQEVEKLFGTTGAVQNLFGLVPEYDRKVVHDDFRIIFGIKDKLHPLSFNK